MVTTAASKNFNKKYMKIALSFVFSDNKMENGHIWIALFFVFSDKKKGKWSYLGFSLIKAKLVLSHSFILHEI